MSDSDAWKWARLALLLILIALVPVPPISRAQGRSETWRADPAVAERLARRRPGILYDEQRVPRYTLPSLFEHPPTSLHEWEGRRVELLELLQQHLFGQLPAPPERIDVNTVGRESLKTIARGVRKRIEVTCHVEGGKTFRFGYWLYGIDGERRPVFVVINNRSPELAKPDGEKFGGFIPVPLLLEAGFAVAVFQHKDLAPDDTKNYRAGLLHHVLPEGERAADAPGAIAAWAWGASRVLDSLADEPLVDDTRAVVIGHSRGGKTALLAGAMDPRFSLAVSNNSGSAGAALFRRQYGERIEHGTTRFNYWYCPRAAAYANAEDAMPIDQHFLIAANAPRHVYVASASDDLWADPRGEWLGLVNAAPAFEALGLRCLTPNDTMPPVDTPVHRGHTSYHVRSGEHNLLESDWKQFILAARRSWAKPN